MNQVMLYGFIFLSIGGIGSLIVGIFLFLTRKNYNFNFFMNRFLNELFDFTYIIYLATPLWVFIYSITEFLHNGGIINIILLISSIIATIKIIDANKVTNNKNHEIVHLQSLLEDNEANIARRKEYLKHLNK